MLFASVSFAQRFRNGITELGLLLGGSNYFGDLAPEIKWKETHPAAGLYFRYNHSSYFSSRYQFAMCKISGNDGNFNSNKYRSLQFESNIYELSYILEFNFRTFGANANQHEETSTTYVFSGLNMFLFNPQKKLPSGDRVDLRDFGTEGQHIGDKKEYSLIQPAFTLGLGYKINIKRKTVIGLEVGFRKTFTDYLDDTKGGYPDYNQLVAKEGSGAGQLSQPQTADNKPVIDKGTMRGDSHLKDWYFIVGITISFRNIIGDPCSGL